MSHLDGRIVGRLLTSKGITRSGNGASPFFSGDELSDSERDEPVLSGG